MIVSRVSIDHKLKEFNWKQHSGILSSDIFFRFFTPIVGVIAMGYLKFIWHFKNVLNTLFHYVILENFIKYYFSVEVFCNMLKNAQNTVSLKLTACNFLLTFLFLTLMKLHQYTCIRWGSYSSSVRSSYTPCVGGYPTHCERGPRTWPAGYVFTTARQYLQTARSFCGKL